MLDSYIEKLLNNDYDNENFKEYIDVFSRFLGYTKEDYKYNGTYLSQYISDFLHIHSKLKLKNEIYNKIFTALAGTELVCELLIDKVFFVNYKSSESVIKGVYVELDEDKVVNQKIEVRIRIESKDKDYVFCKEYENFQVAGLENVICDDVDDYIKIKNIQEDL